uniref:Predicted protein n=1 Tax=Hordeum vulgare subsp. vulgare TaxID=112509 RepID=F2DX92_HORVV|nr:predicted protein [Hordeum vulgare subsp. vulgare]
MRFPFWKAYFQRRRHQFFQPGLDSKYFNCRLVLLLQTPISFHP